MCVLFLVQQFFLINGIIVWYWNLKVVMCVVEFKSIDELRYWSKSSKCYINK